MFIHLFLSIFIAISIASSVDISKSYYKELRAVLGHGLSYPMLTLGLASIIEKPNKHSINSAFFNSNSTPHFKFSRDAAVGVAYVVHKLKAYGFPSGGMYNFELLRHVCECVLQHVASGHTHSPITISYDPKRVFLLVQIYCPRSENLRLQLIRSRNNNPGYIQYKNLPKDANTLSPSTLPLIPKATRDPSHLPRFIHESSHLYDPIDFKVLEKAFNKKDDVPRRVSDLPAKKRPFSAWARLYPTDEVEPRQEVSSYSATVTSRDGLESARKHPRTSAFRPYSDS
jgi:hypothetical protein